MYKFVEFPRSNPRSVVDVDDAVLGIEVTVPAQVALCRLGNIDGQHPSHPAQPLYAGPIDKYLRACGLAGVRPLQHEVEQLAHFGWTSEQIEEEIACGARWRGRAAIDLATEIGLPPDGTVLAATRSDLDSVGAMAVLLLRRLGLLMGPAVFQRIRRVAEADTFAPSERWEPSPLPTEVMPWPSGSAAVSDTRELAAIASICSPRHGDRVIPMAERVAATAAWLLFGDANQWGAPESYREEVGQLLAIAGRRDVPSGYLRGVLEGARERVEASRLALAAEVAKPGAIELRCPGCGERWAPRMHAGGCPVGASREYTKSPIAVVRVAHAGALAAGYCVAPVVCAFDQAHPGKVTIAAWSAKYMDHAALRESLNAAEAEAGGEPRWGGPATLTASPQVECGTRLSEVDVISLVLSCAVNA